MRIAYLGPRYSFSYLAAQRFLKAGDELREYPTITHAIGSVGGECDAAVVPVENSSEGGVSDTLDALIAKDGLFINYEHDFKIELRLLTMAGADEKDIRTIITHKQPYGQCRDNLSRLYPDAEIVFADSTSAAARAVKDKRTAAIGGIALAADGLAASDYLLNDCAGNRTRFIFISRSEIRDSANTKGTVIFESENRPGGLVSLLQVLQKYGVNMTKIESRPRKDIADRYLFIVDFAGNVMNPEVETALREIRGMTVYYKYLGCYSAV